MLNHRRKIFISLGNLVEKVDFEPFINFIVASAKEKKPGMDKPAVLVPLLRQGLELAEKFNVKALASAVEEKESEAEQKDDPACESANEKAFRNELLKLFDITMEAEMFWKKWNDIIVVGEIAKHVQELKTSFGDQASFEFFSDSNFKHLNKIKACATEQKMVLNIHSGTYPDVKLPLLEGMPLSATCITRKDIASTLQDRLSRVCSADKMAPECTIIFADPGKITNPIAREFAVRKFEAVRVVCDELSKQQFRVNLITQDAPIEKMLDKMLMKKDYSELEVSAQHVRSAFA